MSALKIIARIVLILGAASLVVGAVLALSQTSLGAQLLFTRDGPEGVFRNAPANAGQPPSNFALQAGFPAGERGGDLDRAGGGSFILNLVRNLGTVGAIVLVYVAASLAFSRLKGWFRRNRKPLRSATF